MPDYTVQRRDIGGQYLTVGTGEGLRTAAGHSRDAWLSLHPDPLSSA